MNVEECKSYGGYGERKIEQIPFGGKSWSGRYVSVGTI